MFTRAKIGDSVKIVHSVYSGVGVGEVGIVEGEHTDPQTHEEGYGVVFEKFWPCTYINEKPPFERRILWFPIDAVEVLTAEQVATLQLQKKKK